MRLSQFHLATVREVPADAEIASHRLMLRAGMIRKLSAGIYTWSPLGLRVLQRVEFVVREEMQRAGALEMLMPAVQPRELWQETGRWEKFGGQLLKMRDRKDQEYCFGPTHEEVVTDFARHELKSYRQLPLCVFQIQTKFRDEIRPRFGVMRSREFLMKDAYSFHLDAESLAATYEVMREAYCRIFDRLGLRYRMVDADTGAIGGSASNEFHVLADAGEDAIAVSDGSDYAANVELAESLAPTGSRPAATAELLRVATPSCRSIAEVSALLDVAPETCIKTLVMQGTDGLVLLCLRGDHEINEVKVARLPELGPEARLADEEAIRAAFGAGPGSLGPVGAPPEIPILVDRHAALLADFVCGGNRDDSHFTGANWDRDAPTSRIADLRTVVDGDPAADGSGALRVVRGIEVGHIFQLGDQYASDMNATVLDESGKPHVLSMGCYGIGISRIVAAAIEQNHDELGIRWPQAMAPWQVAICLINPKSDSEVSAAAESLYRALSERGIQVALDDRGLRPGQMFADIELIGIPHRVVISRRGLDSGKWEYRARGEKENREYSEPELIDQFCP